MTARSQRWRQLFCPPRLHLRVVRVKSSLWISAFLHFRPKTDYVRNVLFTAGGCVQHEMVHSRSAPQINAPLGARRRQHYSHTRRSASLPSSAYLLWWHRPPLLQADIRRAAQEMKACRPPRTDAEIALPQPSRIDFLYGARATEPARAPAPVAPRGCPLSLRCAHCLRTAVRSRVAGRRLGCARAAAADDAPPAHACAVVGASPSPQAQSAPSQQAARAHQRVLGP